MALRYATLKELGDITTDELRELIDWFQGDVGHVPAASPKPDTPGTQPQSGSGEGPDFDDEVPF